MEKKKTNFFKSKTFRYGTMSVIFTAVLLVLLVVVNAVFTALASHNHWYLDMTEKQMYTVSQTTVDLLSPIKGEKVTIKFMQKRDKIEDSTYDNTGDAYLKQIHELALDYKSRFPDLIDIRYIDLYAERSATKKYVSHGFKLTPTTVVFDNDKGLFNVYEYDKFLLSDKSGFKGEHRITATVLSLCRGKQTAYILSGHGEDPAGDAFLTLLQSCGYNNIKEGVVLRELTPEIVAEDKPRLIVILNPKSDIQGAVAEDGGKGDDKNDVYWLEYLTGTGVLPMPLEADQPYASLMVFAGPSENPGKASIDFPNINSVLYKWGMTMHTSDKDLVRETQNNVFGGADLYKILPQYTASAGEFTNRVAMDGAGTVDVFEASDVQNTGLLAASAGAVNDNPAFPAAGKAVLAYGIRKIPGENNTQWKYNYATACADTSIISDAYLISSSFANESFITYLVDGTIEERQGSSRVNIDYKDYVKEEMVNSTLSQNKAFLVFMAAVIPAAIVILGTVIFIYRRNRV